MRVALSLLSGVALPPHSSFLSLLWEEKGVLDTSEGQSAVGAGIPDPIILDSFLQMNSRAGWVCTSPWIPILSPLEALSSIQR